MFGCILFFPTHVGKIPFDPQKLFLLLPWSVFCIDLVSINWRKKKLLLELFSSISIKKVIMRHTNDRLMEMVVRFCSYNTDFENKHKYLLGLNSIMFYSKAIKHLSVYISQLVVNLYVKQREFLRGSLTDLYCCGDIGVCLFT